MGADSLARKPVTRLARISLERKRPRTFVTQGLFSFLKHVKRSARHDDPAFLRQPLDSHCGYQTFFFRIWATLNFWNQLLSAPGPVRATSTSIKNGMPARILGAAQGRRPRFLLWPRQEVAVPETIARMRRCLKEEPANRSPFRRRLQRIPIPKSNRQASARAYPSSRGRSQRCPTSSRRLRSGRG